MTVINVKTGKPSQSSGPVAVRLSEPRMLCGHEVFTTLEERVYIDGQVAGDFKSELDEVGPDEEGCPLPRLRLAVGPGRWSDRSGPPQRGGGI